MPWPTWFDNAGNRTLTISIGTVAVIVVAVIVLMVIF
jgi:hypothetical protein